MRVNLGDPLTFRYKKSYALFSLSNAVLVCFKLGYLPRYLNVFPLFRIEFIKRFFLHFAYRFIYD